MQDRLPPSPRWRKRFNTAGVCQVERHYMLPPLRRLPQARQLVENGDYFVLHAPRQSGKSTLLLELARQLTEEGKFAALYMSCEAGEAKGDDDLRAQSLLVSELASEAQSQLPPELRPPPLPESLSSERLLTDYLEAWCASCPRPVVLFLDEIDALRGQSLISVLRQLRAAFRDRPQRAPWSVVLCGLRDVRDYKMASGGDGQRLGTASPFNIKVASLTLGTFSESEVFELLEQHTETTGQVFAPEAKARLFELSGGQPWLVNALARELMEELKVEGTITAEQVDVAKERLILARATHLDSLVDRLTEPRVKRVLESLLAGSLAPVDPVFNDDVSYVVDLGLVKHPPLRVANPIYTEVIARVLSAPIQYSVVADPRSFVTPDGRFDMDVLLREFSAFWVEHGEHATRGQLYREVEAQLVLMAFLQRVVNGGGTVTREYGIARSRIDLLVTWPWTDGAGKRQVQREALELKVWREGESDPLKKGLEQLESYLDRLGLETGVLVIFDRRSKAPKLSKRTKEQKAKTPAGKVVRLLRA